MGILPKLILLLIGSVFIAVGGGIAYFTWISGSWPTASAIVTESKVIGNGGKVRAEVSYNFQVGNHPYHGNTVSYDDYSSSFASHAQGIVNAYPVGKTIQIHYEPGSPQSSVIRGGSIGIFPRIFLGIGLLLIAWPVLAILKDLLLFAWFLASQAKLLK